jgi:hypothetical protein
VKPDDANKVFSSSLMVAILHLASVITSRYPQKPGPNRKSNPNLSWINLRSVLKLSSTTDLVLQAQTAASSPVLPPLIRQWFLLLVPLGRVISLSQRASMISLGRTDDVVSLVNLAIHPAGVVHSAELSATVVV